jgi:hypothetical protein
MKTIELDDFFPVEDEDFIDREKEGFIFSKYKAEDLRILVDYVLAADKDYSMGVEVMDAILSKLAEGQSVQEAIWFAACEWDV